ncbi:hypothetical protein BAUCODRAFT_78716 [Baudoinia panamericana UAMH 10762]|uniref:Major facilitator superfamily (MFS) profile domain-containing protein n=1 Tax=Baudoinia panamericana (strain UAMH 10762) TaxID=717646 RepID=M2LES9_BAUPA|nr:uncharacterized protein BAUCODRAFT_78716 [Baudoinia panamericana UAMH 10762]EMC92492.1 hypothetical protein BAUCODRAFT_78716 [Baudoinia panamericana UAMH 10762]
MVPFGQQFGSQKLPDGSRVLTATDVALYVAVPNSGCLLGLPAAVFLGNRIGRKKTLLIAAFVNAASAAVHTAAPNIAALVVARWIQTASILMFIVMSSALLAEISPSEIRGILTGLSIVLIDAAAIVAQGVNYAFSKVMAQYAFRVPLGITVAIAVLLFGALLFIDDSPTHYLSKGNEEQAWRSLRRIRRGYTEADLTVEMASLKHQAVLVETETQMSRKELFKGTNRRRTFIALAVANMQQLSGIAFATNYVTVFLSTIGGDVSAFTLAMVVAVLAFAGAVAGLFIVDRVGRRFLALSSFSILFVINLVVGIMGFLPLTNPAVPRTIAAFCCMFAFFFAAGFGPLTYILSAEVPTARLKNASSAFCFFCVACFATVVVYCLPYIADAGYGNLGAKTYLIFAAWMLGCIVVTFFCIPETKGRTPAELDEMFAIKLPARKFKGMFADSALASREQSLMCC